MNYTVLMPMAGLNLSLSVAALVHMPYVSYLKTSHLLLPVFVFCILFYWVQTVVSQLRGDKYLYSVMEHLAQDCNYIVEGCYLLCL